MSWKEAMAALNERLLDEFPDTIYFNDAPVDCIAPPLDIFKQINPNTYDAKVTFSFQIREADRDELGIKLQSIIELESPYAEQFGKTRLAFQVHNFQPDKNDSLVRLICNFKQ